MIDRPNCPICGKRILWIMRAAGCCLGPFVRNLDDLGQERTSS